MFLFFFYIKISNYANLYCLKSNYLYKNKLDLELNNLQRLISRKNQIN